MRHALAVEVIDKLCPACLLEYLRRVPSRRAPKLPVLSAGVRNPDLRQQTLAEGFACSPARLVPITEAPPRSQQALYGLARPVVDLARRLRQLLYEPRSFSSHARPAPARRVTDEPSRRWWQRTLPVWLW